MNIASAGMWSECNVTQAAQDAILVLCQSEKVEKLVTWRLIQRHEQTFSEVWRYNIDLDFVSDETYSRRLIAVHAA